MNGIADGLHLSSYQSGCQIETDRVFGKQPRFTIDAHVVAVGFLIEPLRFHDLRALSVHRAHELKLKIDVLSTVARRIGVGQIGGDQFLPRAEQVHVPHQLVGAGGECGAVGDSIGHDGIFLSR